MSCRRALSEMLSTRSRFISSPKRIVAASNLTRSIHQTCQSPRKPARCSQASRFNSTVAESLSVGPTSVSGVRNNASAAPEESQSGTLKVFDSTSQMPPRKQILLQGNEVQVYSADSNESVTIPNIWLRDNCQCNSCVHDITKQRLLDTFEIPQDLAIGSSEREDQDIKIKWSDGHESIYTADFIANGARSKRTGTVRQGQIKPILWTSSIAETPPTVPYQQVMHPAPSSLSKLLRKLRQYGFCYITHTPTDPSSTERALTRLSFIRETHYGAFYDFTSDLSSADTAYTSIALPAHTDTTYFSDPAGLQAFHLLSHTSGSGGESLLVDGFSVARQLKTEDPDAYEVLSTVNVHAHASGNDGISIQPYHGFPVLNHDPANPNTLLQIRWNSSDRAAIDLPVQQTPQWYDAARKWNALLKKKENEYWSQLTPGKILVFDNWRVLHGRSAFTGKRRICGGYINRDDWVSKFKMSYFGEGRVLGNLVVETDVD